jgi:sugar O-acyltransferase (sialic acid O-acetyltransferase NeuD family)
MKDVFIIGTGGLAREVASIVGILSRKGILGRFSGFIANQDDEIGKVYSSGVVIGSDKKIPFGTEDVDVIIAIGHSKIKSKVHDKYKNIDNISFPNVIDPRSNIDLNGFSIGIGNIITAGVFISCDVKIDNFCLINWNSTIGHDVIIKSYAVVNPGARVSGFSNIAENVLIGANSVILENILIGSNVSIGAGAVVTKNVGEGLIMIGVPAKEKISL